MKKIIKIIIIILIIVSLLVGLVAGLKVIRKKNAKKVAVYSVKSVMLDPAFFMEDSTSYGEIGSDKVQSVYVSDTQKVKEVLVHEGQEVKRGDILLTYDSTLTELQLERAGNELRQEEKRKAMKNPIQKQKMIAKMAMKTTKMKRINIMNRRKPACCCQDPEQ